jgi:hypothetical protein
LASTFLAVTGLTGDENGGIGSRGRRARLIVCANNADDPTMCFKSILLIEASPEKPHFLSKLTVIERPLHQLLQRECWSGLVT